VARMMEEYEKESQRIRDWIMLAQAWKQVAEQRKAERDELAMELRSRGYGWVVSRILDEKA